MKKETKTIAIIVQNIIQWYSVLPLVKYIDEKRKYNCDVIVFDPKGSDKGYYEIKKSLESAILGDKYKITEQPRETYDLALAPYSNMITFPCKYRMGYSYGAATTKTYLTLLPEFKEGFHGMFLHDTYGAQLTSVYAKTYMVPDLRLAAVHHKKISDRPVVLFLPTYHEPNTNRVVESLGKLRDKYYIIIKSHHGTDFLEEEARTKKLIESAADEVYDSTEDIMSLFDKADMILSDNSGAAMDAFYSKIPVAITAKEINKSIADIDTLQYTLVKHEIFPYTDDPTPQKLDDIIKTALSKKTKSIQDIESDKVFPNKKGGAREWYKILEDFLESKEDNYCKIHDYLLEKKNELLQERDDLYINANELTNKLKDAQEEIANLNSRLALYENSRAHRAIETLLQGKRKKEKKKNGTE